MNLLELDEAKKFLAGLKKAVAAEEPGTPEYWKCLRRYLEVVVTVKGHAWCMDIAGERRKIAKLVAVCLQELNVYAVNDRRL